MRPSQRPEQHDETPVFADVLAEMLRAPYVWWLLLAMVLQAYTPLYIAPVAAAIAAATVWFARQAVVLRRAEPARERVH